MVRPSVSFVSLGTRTGGRRHRPRHGARERPGVAVETVTRRLQRAVREVESEPLRTGDVSPEQPDDGVAAGWVPDGPPAPAVTSAPPLVGGAQRGSDSSRPIDPRHGPSALQGVVDRLPLELRAAAVAPARRAVAGLVVVAVAALLLAFVLWELSRPVSRPAAAVQRTSSEVGRAPAQVHPAPSATTAVVVTVHVAGAVRRPGLVQLPSGARVSDAVAQAGGPTSKAAVASVNLARPLVDGEQVVVLTKGQAPVGGVAPTAGSAPAAGGSSQGTVVDINTATVEQLDGLPGVGPVLAQRIVDWRTRNGRFSAVDELREVAGIGDAKFADLRGRVRV